MYILYIYNNYQLQEMLGNTNNYLDVSFEREMLALRTIISYPVFLILNENLKNSNVQDYIDTCYTFRPLLFT